jgi:hypothetical protein
MKYKLIDETEDYTLVRIVEEHLVKGWNVQGGVAISIYGGNIHYYQALIAFEEGDR